MVATRQIDVRTRPRVGAVAAAVYGAVSYLAFVAVFLYAVAFLADTVVPRTVDRGGPHSGTLAAAAIDAARCSGSSRSSTA